MTFSLTYDGINNLVFNVFRVPFSVAIVFLSLTTLFGIHLRSYTTQKQMELAGLKNNFDNYYKHRDEFKKHILSVCREKEVIESNLFFTHRLLFPGVKNGNYYIDSEFCNGFIKDLKMSREKLSMYVTELTKLEINSPRHIQVKDNLCSIYFEVCQRCAELGFSFNEYLNHHIKDFDYNDFDFVNYKKFAYVLNHLPGRFQTIFSFDENYRYTG